MAAFYQDKKKFGEAFQAFEKAIEHKPDFAEAYNNKGKVLKDMGKLAEAVESFEKLSL